MSREIAGAEILDTSGVERKKPSLGLRGRFALK
jgi:hypothetical protein